MSRSSGAGRPETVFRRWSSGRDGGPLRCVRWTFVLKSGSAEEIPMPSTDLRPVATRAFTPTSRNRLGATEHAMTGRAIRTKRADYRHFLAIPTRWSDNDAYAHVNNVVYYSWFDTVVNRWLVENGLLDIAASPVVSLVVETGCSYFESVAFPDTVHAGLAVERLGSSSIIYAIGIFREGSDDAAAQGRFVHVTVDRATQRPVPIPGQHARQAAGPDPLAAVQPGSTPRTLRFVGWS